MHFYPKGHKNDNDLEKIPLKLNETEIEEVTETKFLGVTIDNQLSWNGHITSLTKKLKCCAGQINRISNFIPKDLHKSIYHTLYESHLNYGITVWGGVSVVKLKPLFIAQKHCIRILFGDKESYLEKFRTTARARPYQAQKLGQEFFEKEHSKPIFNCNKIMTIFNLYNYQLLNNTYKLLKLRTPIALYSCLKISQRKETLLHLPKHISESFIYRATMLWNTFLTCNEGLLAKNLTAELGSIRTKIQELIFKCQGMGDQNEWHYDINFKLRQS